MRKCVYMIDSGTNKKLHIPFQHLCNVPVAHDRSGDQLREHRDIRSETDIRLLRIGIVPVKVDRIRHRLECIETDADRQTQMQRLQKLQTQSIQIAGQEIPVFEESEQHKIHYDARNEILFCPFTVAVPVFSDGFAEEIIECDGADHQQHIHRFSPAVEKQTDQKQHQIAKTPRNGVIHKQHRRQIGA